MIRRLPLLLAPAALLTALLAGCADAPADLRQLAASGPSTTTTRPTPTTTAPTTPPLTTAPTVAPTTTRPTTTRPTTQAPAPAAPEPVVAAPAPEQRYTPQPEVAAAAPPARSASGCNPNYDPCVPDDPDDVDCEGGSGNGPSYVSGPVRVTGDDVYGLDRDGDDVACE